MTVIRVWLNLKPQNITKKYTCTQIVSQAWLQYIKHAAHRLVQHSSHLSLHVLPEWTPISYYVPQLLSWLQRHLLYHDVSNILCPNYPFCMWFYPLATPGVLNLYPQRLCVRISSVMWSIQYLSSLQITTHALSQIKVTTELQSQDWEEQLPL